MWGMRLRKEHDISPRLLTMTYFLLRARLILTVWLALNQNLNNLDGNGRQRTEEPVKSTKPASLPFNSSLAYLETTYISV